VSRTQALGTAAIAHVGWVPTSSAVCSGSEGFAIFNVVSGALTAAPRRHRALSVVVALLAWTLSFGAASVAGAEGGDQGDGRAQVESLLAGVRSGAALKPLAIDVTLTLEAQRWADTMAAGLRLAHSPNLARILELNFDRAGENVGYSRESLRSIVEGFEASPAHRSNDQDPRWTSVGVGVASGINRQGEREWYVAVLFATRAGASSPGKRPRPVAASMTSAHGS
jgi:uncharacterized protein YkwD